MAPFLGWSMDTGLPNKCLQNGTRIFIQQHHETQRGAFCPGQHKSQHLPWNCKMWKSNLPLFTLVLRIWDIKRMDVWRLWYKWGSVPRCSFVSYCHVIGHQFCQTLPNMCFFFEVSLLGRSKFLFKSNQTHKWNYFYVDILSIKHHPSKLSWCLWHQLRDDRPQALADLATFF